jgi:hypothetical protein
MVVKSFSNDLNFDTLGGGSVREDIDRELAKIAQNLIDPNVKNVVRKLNINLSFKVDEDGTTKITAATKATLAPVEAKFARVVVRRNGAGTLEMKEMRSEAIGQTYIDADTGQLMTDTGEPVHGEEPEVSAVPKKYF